MSNDSLVLGDEDINLAEYNYNLVEVLIKQQRWLEAIETCSKVLELDPVFLPAYQTLGELLYKQEDWDRTINCYQKAIELKPDFAEFHHGLGLALIKLDRWEEAVKALGKATELNPEFAWSHNSLGEALMHLEKWDEAAISFRRAIELKPDFAWSYYNLGNILDELKDSECSSTAYSKALELQPHLPDLKRKLFTSIRNNSDFTIDNKKYQQYQQILLDKISQELSIVDKQNNQTHRISQKKSMEEYLLPDISTKNLVSSISIEAGFPLASDLGFYPTEYGHQGKQFRWTYLEKCFYFDLFLQCQQQLRLVLRVLDWTPIENIENLRCFINDTEIVLQQETNGQFYNLIGLLPTHNYSQSTRISFLIANQLQAPEDSTENESKVGVAFSELVIQALQ